MTSKLEKDRLEVNELWQATLDCGDKIQFSGRTVGEIKNDGLRCPLHPDKYPGFISPIYHKIVSFRKVKVKL